MNKVITSREAILKSAKEIAYRDGIYKLNIRGLATECRVSVGTIYNYFPTKDELISAVSEEFWKSIFEKSMCDHQHDLCFIQFFEQIFMRFCNYLEIFKGDMLNQISFLSQDVKAEEGKTRYLSRIKKVMLRHLEMDEEVRDDIWNEHFDKEEFIEFVFQNMLLALKSEQKDISFFKEVIKKLLY